MTYRLTVGDRAPGPPLIQRHLPLQPGPPVSLQQLPSRQPLHLCLGHLLEALGVGAGDGAGPSGDLQTDVL